MNSVNTRAQLEELLARRLAQATAIRALLAVEDRLRAARERRAAYAAFKPECAYCLVGDGVFELRENGRSTGEYSCSGCRWSPKAMFSPAEYRHLVGDLGGPSQVSAHAIAESPARAS